MISVDLDRIKSHTVKYVSSVNKGGSAALMFDDFMANTLQTLYADAPFPESVHISKSLEEMLRRDFLPKETISLVAPEIDQMPVWRGSTLDGFVLRGAGYVNGDRRYPCHISLDDNIPHGLIAGATGHGKSVLLNSIIMFGALEYAPWELQFILVDAKIVEFKAYGINSVLPHISSIAATEDAEYIISVLEDARQLMMTRNSVFTVAGVKNIKSFRRQDMRDVMGLSHAEYPNPINLSMPHIVIVMDEFQTMFKNAAKKATAINKLIDLVARLGRSTGVHLLMASQELGSDLDKGMLGNLGTRLCLGCLPKTSEQVLGNDEAKTNFGLKGRLIINNNPAVGNPEENVSLRTPFLPDSGNDYKTIFGYMDDLNSLGRLAFPKRPYHDLSFYDEQRFDYEADFYKYILGRAKPQQLYLGEPSYVLRNSDGEKWLRLELREDAGENILIFSPLLKNREKFLKTLFYNFLAMQESYPSVVHKVLYADRSLFESIGFDKLNNHVSYLAREYTHASFSNLRTPLWRKLLIECDESAFGHCLVSEENLEIFTTQIDPDKSFSGELWQKRAHSLLELLKGTSYINGFGFKGYNTKDLAAHVNGTVLAALTLFSRFANPLERVTLNSFDYQFIWLIGLDRTVGLGVDSKSSYVEELKGFMREGPEYKVHYILSTSTMEDTSSLRSAIVHSLLSDLTGSMRSQLRIADDYPDNCAEILGIYYNSSWESDKCRKFKKMKFDEEL